MAGFAQSRHFNLADTPDLADKVAVVTGGSAGLGRDFTARLLLHGIAKVYILARSERRYVDAKAEWAGQHGLEKADIETRTKFVACDLSDLGSVKRAAHVLLGELGRLDILQLNAALSLVQDSTLSPQGVETVFAANHLGHFVLTNLLLPTIEQTAAQHGDARIVTTSSSLHMLCQDLDFSILTSSAPPKLSPAILDAVVRYARSKLANILFTRELAARLRKMGARNVYANSFFPGNVATEAMDGWRTFLGNYGGAAIKGMFQMLIGQSPADASATAMFLAASPKVVEQEIKGRYFVPIAVEEKTSPLAEDKDLAKNLWYWSNHIVSSALGNDWKVSGGGA
ncbi:short chain dehydrogenase/reductase [Saccharata proteae CBS 121410]|uniref:Short chain dehydrogenase/reductase n=1 Tax=Saccharata proteae CBS 121410 TaxID=1314787 RepID=A0A9P4LZ41_9PEZI|nr:short chain dehydrogenase/reductase [Saccharata proteae CBS 121410]